MKKQVLASYSGKPGVVHLPLIESSNHPIQFSGKIASRSYSLSNPINENNKSLLAQKNRPTSQTSKKYTIDQQMMSTIRVDIEKMIETGQSFLQYNHSPLIKQVQLHENLVKLQELFLPFLRDALAFYTSPNSFTDEDKTFITSSSVRSSSFSFLQQWKSVISILDIISEQGISSLFDFINEKFDIIFKGIETVASKPEKHTVIFETIGKSTSILTTSATNLHKLIIQLFENFTDPTSESISYYFSEIKQFLSLYNETFYNVFPKAGFLPYELANLKSDTLTASNDIMNSLRALFTFWPYFKDIDMYKDEIQKLLDSAVCQMRLPSSIVRLIAPLPKKKTKHEQENEKKLRPEFTKLEAFISNVLKTIDKPPLDQKIDLWKRLKMLENMIGDSIQNLNDIIVKIRGQSHNVQNLMVEADSMKKTIEKLRAENSKLFQLNQNFEKQLDEVTKIAEKRKQKIEILQNDAERLEEKQTIEKVSTKLNTMMNKIDSNITKVISEKVNQNGQTESENNDDDSQFKSLEKLNIFVLEKKCKNCRIFDQQRREIMKMLQPLLGSSSQTESFQSLIQTLVKRQEKLEVDNAQMSAALAEKESALAKVEEATKFLMERSGGENSRKLVKKGTGPNDDSNILLQSFKNIEDQHKSDMKAMHDEMKDSHERELNKIAEMFDGIISEDDDTINGYDRKSARRNNSPRFSSSHDSENDRKSGRFNSSNSILAEDDSYNDRKSAKGKNMGSRSGRANGIAGGYDSINGRNGGYRSDTNGNDDRNTDNNNDRKSVRKKRIKTAGPDGYEYEYEYDDVNRPNSKANDENEFNTIVMAKVKKAATKIESLQNELNSNNELLEKVKEWMKTQLNEIIDLDGLSLSQSLFVLMDAIDRRENPLQSKVDRLERESQKVTAQCKKLVDKLCELKFLDRINTAQMGCAELLKVAEKQSMKLNKKLENAQGRVDSHDYEVECTRSSMQTIAERLHHLLQLEDTDIDFGKMDINTLLREITHYVEGLMTGGTKQLFIPVSDINDMAKYARKNSKFPNSPDPKIYLPDIFERFVQDDETIKTLRLFEDPLEEIFKNFDFKKDSFHPNNESFGFLRERIFQLHLILGKDKNIIADSKILNVMKKFISLSSELFSYIASTFMIEYQNEINCSQSNNS